jgi:hypothetical protein
VLLYTNKSSCNIRTIPQGGDDERSVSSLDSVQTARGCLSRIGGKLQRNVFDTNLPSDALRLRQPRSMPRRQLGLTLTGESRYNLQMSGLTIELLSQQSLKEQNLRRWAELMSDPRLEQLEAW